MSLLERSPATVERPDADVLRDGRLGGFEPEELATRFGAASAQVG